MTKVLQLSLFILILLCYHVVGNTIRILMNAKNMVLTWGPKCDFIF